MSDSKVADKVHMGLVVAGHVDAGKSTTTGHLLYKLGTLSERDKDKLQKEAEELGKGSFGFAFLMDKQKEERKRGITIACTTKEFFTEKYHMTIIDAPGHKDFINNMVTGASQADVLLLMVPASMGGFETAIAQGSHKNQTIEGQTRQHARLCNLLGIQEVIIGINKMDDPSVNFSESRFNEVKEEMINMLKQVGYKPKRIPVIPISGYKGDNLTTPSENMPWWKGFSVDIPSEVKGKPKNITGMTLLDALNNVVQPAPRVADAALRMPVSGSLKIPGVGDVITGRIEEGRLPKGATVSFTGMEGKFKAFSIEMHHRVVDVGEPGENVGVNVKGLTTKPKAGDVLYLVGDPKDTAPPRKVVSFCAQVAVQDHPGQLKCTKDGKGGYTPMIRVRTAKGACVMSSITWKQNKNGKTETPDFLERNDMAEVVFKPKGQLYLEPFDKCAGLGRVAIMDSNSLVMLGKVMSVTYEEPDNKAKAKSTSA